MSEKEKKTLEALMAAMPKMSDFEKGKIYGYGEAIAEMREAAEEKKGGTGKCQQWEEEQQQ